MKKLLGIFNRAIASASMRLHVAKANLWRDSYNPLRGLTISRAVTYLEEGERGAFAGLQWLYRYIEMQDATLGALIERRTSAVQKMGWDVKIDEDLTPAEEALADRQAKTLRETYNGIENLKEAIEHLCMASFRGFSILEIVMEGGKITRLEPVPQWHWVRKGINGEWQYNEESRIGTTDGEEIEEKNFVIREVARPINRVALVCFVRKSMSQKDWDGFIETFGIPAVFIIAPENIPKDKEDDYQEVADEITSNARGVLPGGSDVKTVDNGARGTNPFKEHIEYQDAQVVLRGTGGKLTMLTESGSGTLAGGAHSDTFDEIAEAEAEEINEFFRQAVDKVTLERVHPGEKHLVKFAIATQEESDASKAVRDVAILEKSGRRIKDAQITEKTGWEFEEVEEVQEKGGEELPRVENREEKNKASQEVATPKQDEEEDVFLGEARKRIEEALGRDLTPVFEALAVALASDDQEERDEKLRVVSEVMDELTDGELVTEFEALVSSALVNGWGSGDEVGAIRNGDRPGHPFRGNQHVTAKGMSREGRRRKKKAATGAARKDPRKQEEIIKHKRIMREALSAVEAGRGGKFVLGEFPDAVARKMAEAGWHDGTKVRMEINPQLLSHMLKQHGSAVGEQLRGQRALTEEDLVKRLPLVMYDPDEVTLSEGRTGPNGEPRYQFKRKIRDDHEVIVELQVGNRQGKRGVPVTQVKNRGEGKGGKNKEAPPARSMTRDEPPTVTPIIVTGISLLEDSTSNPGQNNRK